ncbi:MAG: amino acid ABC transporter substrate-binding protein [Chitinophagaceae bacterium]|nr:amino acid ABC transporter substrate-binding protein [Chitinophagaceae bacterium]
MMKKITAALCLFVSAASYAQPGDMVKRHKIALFVPLYLDSAFSATMEYNYGKLFPRFLNPGLEFYEGAQLALDSLEKAGIPLEIHVHDTRSGKSVAEITSDTSFQGTELIIAHLANYNEVVFFAGIAASKGIPFINANLPNDGNISGNPHMVILNSTLRAHCQGIYRFLQKNYATARIVAFQQPGAQETTLRTYFNDIAKSTSTIPLKFKFINLENNFTAQQLIPHLDSTELTICVGASLDEGFARNLSQQLAYLNKQYHSRVIGMPTWDAIPFEKKEYAGLEIVYSTPFHLAKTDTISRRITNYFNNVLYSRPSDMVFRGYECIFRFGKLLAERGTDLDSSLGEKKYKVFTDFDIQPVFLNGASQGIDYFENKKLYFVKKVNGEVKGVY